MTDHFEDLWQLSENSFKSEIDVTAEEIFAKISLTSALYKAACEQKPTADIDKIKAHLMGELLLYLSHLSLKDNIDVFDAMRSALKFKITSYSAEVPSP